MLAPQTGVTSSGHRCVAGLARKISPKLRRFVLTVVVGAGMYTFLQRWVFQAYYVPSESMEPALFSGDVVLVNKLAYTDLWTDDARRLRGLVPSRNDVIVFENPDSDADAPLLVKRVVGLPGDTLVMRNGVLLVNGVRAFMPLYDSTYGTSGAFEDSEFRWQLGAAVRNSRFGSPPSFPTLDNWGPVVVSDSHCFVLGDNRHFSHDSRFFGPVAARSILGRVELVYWSSHGAAGVTGAGYLRHRLPHLVE